MKLLLTILVFVLVSRSLFADSVGKIYTDKFIYQTQIDLDDVSCTLLNSNLKVKLTDFPSERVNFINRFALKAKMTKDQCVVAKSRLRNALSQSPEGLTVNATFTTQRVSKSVFMRNGNDGYPYPHFECHTYDNKKLVVEFLDLAPLNIERSVAVMANLQMGRCQDGDLE